MNKCKHCNTETNLFFCPKCGFIFDYPTFVRGNERQERNLASFIDSLVQESQAKRIKIADLVDKGPLAEAIFRKYFEHIAYLQEICNSNTTHKLFDANGESMFDVMTAFGRKCLANECQIAIVGTVKAGKSMFLNAILGREVASTYPTPETASLTKFRFSTKGDYIKVSYYTDKEWDLLWKSVMEASANSYRDDKEDFLSEYNKLYADSIKPSLLNRKDDIFIPKSFEELKEIVAKYTSCKHAEHFFAKEVEVGLSTFNVPKNVVFVDTPGLNDPVSFRSDITRRYLHSANVVLLCVKAASAEIRASELEDIAILFSELRYSKERIYLFGTQVDTQTHFMDYWVEQTKPEFLKYLSGKSYFGTKEKASERIMPVTAWYFNMIQRAKNDRGIWNSAKDVDVLDELLKRCLGRTIVEQYTDKFGSSKGREKCFYEHISELESKTNVPRIYDTIMDGPIKDAEQIIKQDMRDMFVGICNDIAEIADNGISLKEDAVKMGESSDVKERLANLEKDIRDKESKLSGNVDTINVLLQSLSDVTNTIINNLKNK